MSSFFRSPQHTTLRVSKYQCNEVTVEVGPSTHYLRSWTFWDKDDSILESSLLCGPPFAESPHLHPVGPDSPKQVPFLYVRPNVGVI